MKAYKIFFNKKSKKIEVSEFENILSSDLPEYLSYNHYIVSQKNLDKLDRTFVATLDADKIPFYKNEIKKNLTILHENLIKESKEFLEILKEG